MGPVGSVGGAIRYSYQSQGTLPNPRYPSLVTIITKIWGGGGDGWLLRSAVSRLSTVPYNQLHWLLSIRTRQARHQMFYLFYFALSSAEVLRCNVFFLSPCDLCICTQPLTKLLIFPTALPQTGDKRHRHLLKLILGQPAFSRPVSSPIP